MRPLTDDDTAASWELGSIAFGYHDRPMPERWSAEWPGRHAWGVFDESGRLVAKAVDREQGHWFGGRIVPASGVAGVAVAAELRGIGLARLVLTRLLAGARDRGAAISTLFGTIPFPYRRLGWEEAGALTYIALPTMALSTVRAGKGVALRQATEHDVPSIEELYRMVARSGAGMMERSGPMFSQTPVELLAEFHGVTVAGGTDGAVEGYATWNRSPGYDADSKITVFDLIAVTPAATASLLSMLGGWLSVAPTVVLRVPYDDPALLMISSSATVVHARHPWMLRVVDVPAAVATRGWPAHFDAVIELDVVDDTCPWNAGPWRLVLSGGHGRAEPGGRGSVRLTDRGLALLYAGASGAAVLRRAGLLSGGGDEVTDRCLDATFAGPRPTLLDYF